MPNTRSATRKEAEKLNEILLESEQLNQSKQSENTETLNNTGELKIKEEWDLEVCNNSVKDQSNESIANEFKFI